MNEKDKKEEKSKPKPIVKPDRKPTTENGYEELV